MNALSYVQLLGNLLKAGKHGGFMRADEGEMRGRGRWRKLRDGLQEKSGAFFLREAAKEENQSCVLGDSERFAKHTAFRKRGRCGNAIPAENDFFGWNSTRDQFGFLLP